MPLMTLIIVAILLLAYLLIATENLTKMNKAAVAVFAGTLGWVLYISYGSDFVMSEHPTEYVAFLNGMVPTSATVKQFIAQNIFLKYVGEASEIVLFLLATMTIVEILYNNGCFDFISQLLRTRSSKKMLWMLSCVTLVISANLDNLTTTVMMLTIMHGVVQSRRQRMLFGSAIVLAANWGGAVTVIGDPTGLVLWNIGAVTPSTFFLALVIPCLIAWFLPTWWIGRMLPERVDVAWISMPYRGDDTRLNVGQRLAMLIVGIGGLWFIPSFHSITKLRPFLGAFCVLAILWIVNEIFNRNLHTDEMIQRRIPRVLQYGVLQMMLFVMGIMLAVGVVQETGALRDLSQFFTKHLNDNIWIGGALMGLLSTVVDNFATAMPMIAMHPIQPSALTDMSMAGGPASFAQNGAYWLIIAYAVAAGGNILCIGSMSGLALIKMERLHVGWFLKNVGWKSMMGSLLGFVILWVVITFFI